MSAKAKAKTKLYITVAAAAGSIVIPFRVGYFGTKEIKLYHNDAVWYNGFKNVNCGLFTFYKYTCYYMPDWGEHENSKHFGISLRPAKAFKPSHHHLKSTLAVAGR